MSSITLTFEPDPALLRVVRLTAASLATDAGFDVSSIDDLGLAANELTAALLEVATGPLSVTVESGGDGLVLNGVADADSPIQLTKISESILRQTAGRYELRQTETGAGFSLTQFPRAIESA